MSDVKLKPCPFCGGEASINRPSGRMLFCVVCDDCDANGGYYFTEEDAARAWNDRAERSAVPNYCPNCGARVVRVDE